MTIITWKLIQMKICMNTDVMNNWLSSGQIARISGIDLKPIPHPILTNTVQCVVKGQASVFFLKQIPQGNLWLLKKFAPARRPTDCYLEDVNNCLPGGVEFFTCTQRRLLTANHFNLRSSAYKNYDLTELLEGALLMPKVPGSTWASIAEDLRDSKMKLSITERLQICLNLTECISLLEAGQCSHRDLSSTNVFIDDNSRVYLIDWDCLYHPGLSFQPNTTVGTMGYIAPFLKDTDGNRDAAVSWCNYSDRFALSVLISEVLLISPDTLKPHEDGTLFSQAQIDSRGNSFVETQIELLEGLSPQCANLFTQAFFALTFQDCPSPDDWISALKYTLRQHHNKDSNTKYVERIRVCCDDCDTTFRISKAKYDNLKKQGKPALCKYCFEVQLDVWSVEKAQQNLAYPQVSCEHCRRCFRIQRQKLDKLRREAKPILCSSCLTKQLQQWESENIARERNYPKVICTECWEPFRIRKDKLDALSSKGKSVLCKDCLEIKINSNWRL